MWLFVLYGLFVSVTDRQTVGNSEVAARKWCTCSTEQLRTFFFPSWGQIIPCTNIILLQRTQHAAHSRMMWMERTFFGGGVEPDWAADQKTVFLTSLRFCLSCTTSATHANTSSCTVETCPKQPSMAVPAISCLVNLLLDSQHHMVKLKISLKEASIIPISNLWTRPVVISRCFHLFHQNSGSFKYFNLHFDWLMCSHTHPLRPNSATGPPDEYSTDSPFVEEPLVSRKATVWALCPPRATS